MAVVLAVAAALAAVVGVLLAITLGAYLARHRIAAWARRQLLDLAGPAIVRSMPPRRVLDSVLPAVYGERVGHQHITASVLGGAGRELDGRDTAVSRRSSAHFCLTALDQKICRCESTWTHEFSGARNTHRFVIFATADSDVAELIPTERVYPLFELWTLGDEDQLEEFVSRVRETLRVGITYLDSAGAPHEIAPRSETGEEVTFRRYNDFVRLPDGIDRRNLRIIEFDLYDLADADDVVGSIETLTLSASYDFPIDLGYLRWSAPHPCFMEHVVFDVERMTPEAADLIYLVVPSTPHTQAVRGGHTWIRSTGEISVEVNSWMLPGHSVTLLWRPVDEPEPHARPERC